MSAWVARIACLIAVLVGSISDSRAAGDLAEFNTAMKDVSAHNRVAIGYLRTENIDLATLEIDRMRNAWVTFTERFAGNRPDIFEGKSALRQSLHRRERAAGRRRPHAQDRTA